MLCLLVPALFAAPAGAGQPLQAFVSIEPLQYLVKQVGGERVSVTVVVRGSQRPETYEPSPRQTAALAEADIFFGVGLPLEKAWRKQVGVATARSLEWIDLSDGLEGVDGGHDHGHDGIDPHLWLSPEHARRMAATIRDALMRLDDEGRDEYRRNALELDRSLQALDAEIEEILSASDVRVFLVFHPAWGHFARDYGLEQLAIESEGKEPGPRAMIEVIHRAREHGIRTVFVDPRHATRLAETVAEAIGANVEMLDPLAPDYPANLKRAALAIAGAD